MITGIYRIRNTVSQKDYIGQASDILDRWRQHRYLLKLGEHSNRHLQASWNKHGEKAFSFKVVEECASSALNAREKFWIAALPAERFNIGAGGDESTRGVDWTQEHRLNFSRARGGKPFFGENLATGEIKRYDMQSEAVLDGFQQSHVWACLNRRRSTHKGHTFYYDEAFVAPPVVEQKRPVDKRNRPIVGTCIATGEEKTFDYVALVKEAGFSRPAVARVLSGEMYQTNGWTWRYVDGLPHQTMSASLRGRLRIGARARKDDGLSFFREGFRRALIAVWGEDGELISFEVVTEPPPADKAPAALRYDTADASAEGRVLKTFASFHTLAISDSLTTYTQSVVEKVLLHEAIHVGYPRHDRHFERIAAEVGTASTLAAMLGNGFVVEIQRGAKASRFQECFSTPDRDTAFAFAEQKRAGAGRYRVVY